MSLAMQLELQDILVDCAYCPGAGGFHSNIKVLDLSYNNISHISRSFFRPAELSLTHLHLSHNILVNATWDVFGNMPHLHWLDLSHNRLMEISFDTFRNTRKLQVSNIYFFRTRFLNFFPMQVFLASHNNLENFHAETFRVLSGLRVVDLSHNAIRVLPDGLFFGEGLEKLDLSHNDINRMPLSSLSFGSASSLCDLDLSHNDIASIPNGEMFGRFKVFVFYVKIIKVLGSVVFSRYVLWICLTTDYFKLMMELSQL